MVPAQPLPLPAYDRSGRSQVKGCFAALLQGTAAQQELWHTANAPAMASMLVATNTSNGLSHLFACMQTWTDVLLPHLSTRPACYWYVQHCCYPATNTVSCCHGAWRFVRNLRLQATRRCQALASGGLQMVGTLPTSHASDSPDTSASIGWLMVTWRRAGPDLGVGSAALAVIAAACCSSKRPCSLSRVVLSMAANSSCSASNRRW